MEEKRALANCVATILPCCVLSGGYTWCGRDWTGAWRGHIWQAGRPGGFVGGKLFTRVPAVWLRRLFAARFWYTAGCGICCDGHCIAPAGRDGLRVLSAWGVGGGTLLLLVMTLFFGVGPGGGSGVNLLYFLPTAAMGLIWHRQNGLLDKALLRRTVPWALVTAAAGPGRPRPWT